MSSTGVAKSSSGYGGRPGAKTQSGVALCNWNLSYATAPARVVIAKDAAHIQEVVRNAADYPSPISAVGALHSVTQCVVNDGGTIVCTTGLNRIIGLVGNGDDRLVKCEAGVKLLDLHKWLAEQSSEISFCPEIGDATVGSLVTTTSKDSSVDGLGYLSALVYELKYVAATGELVELSAGRDKERLGSFIGSHGLLGIVVEVTLKCRPLTTIATSLAIIPASRKTLAKQLLTRKAQHANLFAIIRPGAFAYVEQRDRTKLPRWAFSWYNAIIVFIKYRAFLNGSISWRVGLLSPLNLFFHYVPAVHYRYEFTNRYPRVGPSQDRLDFTFYEFDLAQFEAVVDEMLALVDSFRADTGFGPEGLAMYFVERPGDKPTSSFSGAAGTSFMMDPFCGKPDDPRWHAYLDRVNELAARHGARMSPSQTKRLAPQHCSLDVPGASPRFTTAFYQQYLKTAARGAGEPAVDGK